MVHPTAPATGLFLFRFRVIFPKTLTANVKVWYYGLNILICQKDDNGDNHRPASRQDTGMYQRKCLSLDKNREAARNQAWPGLAGGPGECRDLQGN